MDIDLYRLPPQAIDLEEAVLGALLNESDAITRITSIIKPESFYKEQHLKIYSGILGLFEKGNKIDLLTVTNHLRKLKDLEDVGGPLYLSQLLQKAVTAVHIEEHAQIIQDKYVQREIIRTTSEIQKAAFADDIDPDDIINRSLLSFTNIGNTLEGGNTLPAKVVVSEAWKMIHDRIEDKSLIDDVYTGIGKIIIPNGLCIIAARPSMGKTSFSLQLCNNIAIDHGVPTMLFSLEMKSHQVMRWIISQRTQIPNEQLKLGRLDQDEINAMEAAVGVIEKAPLYINDKPGINVFQIRSELIRLKNKYELGLVIIDYLQLISGITTRGKVKNRENEVSEISRQLQMVHKELNIPLIALCQLNRSVMDRKEAIPQLHHLRESGSLEQDADFVAFLHRPEYYDVETFDSGPKAGQSTAGICQFIIRKYRDGKLGGYDIKFIPEKVSFKSIDEEKDEPFSDF